MSYGFKFECNKCAYKTGEIIQEDRKALFLCNKCRDIVLAYTVPYKYDLSVLNVARH